MAKRCLHPRLKSFRFKSGEIMTMCPDCKHGENHYDQSTPILGKLYTRYRNAVQEVEPEPDDFVLDTTADPEESDEEIVVAELSVPTFAALEDNNEIVTPELDDSGEVQDGEVELEEIEA